MPKKQEQIDSSEQFEFDSRKNPSADVKKVAKQIKSDEKRLSMEDEDRGSAGDDDDEGDDLKEAENLEYDEPDVALERRLLYQVTLSSLEVSFIK